MKYNPNEIEAKWQKYWLENETFKAENNSNKPKYYVLRPQNPSLSGRKIC